MAYSGYLILFLHGEYDGYCIRECEKESEIEDTIRYWLGKSPGIHKNEMESILVVPKEHAKEHLPIIEKMQDEELAYARKMNEQNERETYERLKKKFSQTNL